MQEHNLAGVVEWDSYEESSGQWPGKLSSQWVALARKREHFGDMLTQTCENGENGMCWSELSVPEGAPLWTDDFSNLLQIYEWPEWPWNKKAAEKD